MKTELTYLLEELDNWGNDNVITIKSLKRMIEKSFNEAAKDEEAMNDFRNCGDL
jgi:hypothetical protein